MRVHAKGYCSVCEHADRTTIDEAILRGDSYGHISEMFGIPKSTVYGHGRLHVARDSEQAAAISQEVLIEKLERLELDARRILGRAERARDYRAAIAAVRELRGQLDALGRLAGVIRDRAAGGVSIHFNLLASPEWQDVQTRLLAALEPYPEAQLAVARALSPARALPPSNDDDRANARRCSRPRRSRQGIENRLLRVRCRQHACLAAVVGHPVLREPRSLEDVREGRLHDGIGLQGFRRTRGIGSGRRNAGASDDRGGRATA